jgi:DNA adenine methylase
VKWAGGKTQLLETFESLIPRMPEESTFHEPFVGSGALFFHLHVTGRLPRRVILSDLNAHLVACYRTVRDAPLELATRLRELRSTHSKEQFYEIRRHFNEDPIDEAERAALTIYMNKAGFNGLYRVNSRGYFNVPCGYQEGGPYLPRQDQLEACSEALKRAIVEHSRFDATLARAQPGDFVYLDPPYVPVDENANFTRYDKTGFRREDHERLRDAFAELDRRGCKVMLSNSNTPLVHELFDDWRIDFVDARRNINRKPKNRGPIKEVVVRNYGGPVAEASVETMERDDLVRQGC